MLLSRLTIDRLLGPLLLLTLVSCGGSDDGDGDSEAADSDSSTSTTEGGSGETSADTGDACSMASSSIPAGDPDGPYGPCQSKDDCEMDAHHCNGTCAGSCSPGCLNDDECPAVTDYSVICRPSASGSDPTGDCIIACMTTAECPGGMTCDNLGYCYWASGG